MRRLTRIAALAVLGMSGAGAQAETPNIEHRTPNTEARTDPTTNSQQPTPSIQQWMPRVEDFTLMGWAEEFPGHTPAAPWTRVIRTGRYAMALDTEAMRVPYFGAVEDGGGYEAAAREDARVWRGLPSADLALTITAGGKAYRCTAGGKWTDFGGPRLVESGRFVQRADVTDLVFESADGARLNVEARFETVAWPDRLALILAARPGLLSIPAGEACFGRVGGGYGLDGTNHLEIPHSPEIDPERFTLEFWAFVPADHQVSERTHPWLACKNHHEQADGNYGIVLLGGVPQARMNIGGGRTNEFSVAARPGMLKVEAWNHLAMSYDGDSLRFHVNGASGGERKIGRPRTPGRTGLAFGRRQDNCGDGYHFRGAVDEIRIHDRALTAEEIRGRFTAPEAASPAVKPVREWSFRADGRAAASKPGETWHDASMAIRLAAAGCEWRGAWAPPQGGVWSAGEWREAAVVVQADELRSGSSGVAAPCPSVSVRASELPGGAPRPVDFDAARGWHKVNLDGIEPIVPAGAGERRNDAIERVRLVLSNPADTEQIARLVFEKTSGGIRQRIGAAITGVSAVLRDADGHPTGIPVQLSKNWHNRPEGGVYAGQWFHGFSQVLLSPRATVDLELVIVYGHWGGVAAASHAQLCLIGWGSNQQWDQSALGSWGESICYEPDQAQAQCAVLDVRPVMVNSMSGDRPWGWTHNVGGGDFFRLFDMAGRRGMPGRMRTAYLAQGPCLTEVVYAGRTGDGIEQSATVSLARTDDLVRGTYRLRLDVTKPVPFSRFVILQIGADSYSYTGERKMALGDETGLRREWATQWGGDTNRTAPAECTGRVPWISLHETGDAFRERSREASPGANRQAKKVEGAWANRGIVIRAWKARLGGREAAPWMVERGVKARGAGTSTADIVPPPGVTRLEPGDFVEATVEHIIVPQSAADYYGPNEALRAALARDGDTWRMILREAAGNDRRVTVTAGRLERTYPDIRLSADGDAADFALSGGLGYVPVTVTGLASPRGHVLSVDGRPVDQSVHGNDFWQTGYDPVTRRWSRTWTIPAGDGRPCSIRFERCRTQHPTANTQQPTVEKHETSMRHDSGTASDETGIFGPGPIPSAIFAPLCRLPSGGRRRGAPAAFAGEARDGRQGGYTQEGICYVRWRFTGAHGDVSVR